MKRWGHLFRFIAAAALVAVMIWPVSVFGHARVVEMSPNSDSEVTESPAVIRVVFNQKLELVAPDSLILQAADGSGVPTGKPMIGDDGTSMEIIDVPELLPGNYQVVYKITSLDGHLVSGSYTFTVSADIASDPGAPAPERTHPEEPPTTNTGHDDHADHGGHVGQSQTTFVDESITNPDAFQQLRELETDDYSHAVFYVVFLPLAGMALWGIFRRGRTEEQTKRDRGWMLQLARLQFLLILAILAQYLHRTVGFEDPSLIRAALLESTNGLGWALLLVLTGISLFVAGRWTTIDAFLVVAMIAIKTQIGHAAASDDRVIVSVFSGVHLIASSLWAGGLLLILLLWRKYRYEAVQLLPKISGASLASFIALTLSGLLISAFYLPDLSYLLETRWGVLLIGKLIVVGLVVITASFIRMRFRKHIARLGPLIRIDVTLMIVIALTAGLLTRSEPIPNNEPLHWHVMGETVHMTVDVSPLSIGMNGIGLTVWLPEEMQAPQEVQFSLIAENPNEVVDIPLQSSDRGDPTPFIGFREYHYQSVTDQLDRAGIWRVRIVVIDQYGQNYEFIKRVKVYG